MKDECNRLKKIYQWPLLILNHIKNFNPENKILQMYLSDIQWFDYHQGIYEINNKKEVKNMDSPSNSRSANASFEHLRSPQSVSIDSEIKNMLLNTQIINEEFFHMTRNIRDTDVKENKDLKITTKMSLRGLDNNVSKNNYHRHYSSYCLSDYLNNTFLHSTTLNIYEENKNYMDNLEKIEEKETNENNIIQMKKCLFHYKGITEKIEQHLKDKKNFIFGEILLVFSNYFCKKYCKTFSKNSNIIDKSQKKKIIEKINFAFEELKDFIKTFQMAISFYYKLDEYERVLKYFLFTKENLQNFLTSIIFDEKIYNLVYEAQSFIDKDLEIELIEKLNLIKNCEPNDFDISDRYCLNERTLKYFKEKKKFNSPLEKNILESQILTESLINNETEPHTRRTTITNNKFVLELKDSSIQKSDNKHDFEEETLNINEQKFHPYLKAIKNLKKIQKLRSPLHKLKNMRITAELIKEEIKEFYQNLNIDFQANLGGDELLPIHIYIISKADIPSLFTHCALIDKFLSSNLTSSISGYY